MKILVLATTFPRWGNDRTAPFVKELCLEVSKRSEIEQLVLVPHSPGASRFESLAPNLLIKRLKYAIPARAQKVFYEGGAATKKKGISFKLFSMIFIVALFFSTLKNSLSREVRVIHGHWLVPSGLVAVIVAKITRKTSVVTVHGGDIFTMNGSLGVRIKRFVLKQADHVMVNSSLTEEACNKIHQREYSFGPMGVNTEEFPLKTLRPNNNKLLFVGRLTREKGAQYLIKSLKYLDDEFQLIVVGDGPLMGELKQIIDQENLSKRVEFKGWVDHKELSKQHRAAGIFVGPSITLDNGWQEGMGLVYLEALFAGLPVITSNSTGARDFIKEGINGYVVEEKKSKEIASAINKLTVQPLNVKNFNKQAKDLQKKYNWQICADRYLKVYN